MINIDTIALQAATDIMALPSANDLLGGAGQLKAKIQIIVRGHIEDAVDKVTQHVQAVRIDDLPQPFAGAITLLETIAAHGAQAAFDDGTATPNAKLCERFARELRAYAAQPAVVAASDDLREGRTMLDDLIASITKHGNYSQESTLAFLNQLRQCLAAPLHEAGNAAAVQDPKAAFEEWAAKDGTYDLRPYNWKVISVGGVPYDGYVRPYKQDRTVYAYQGFVAGLTAAAAPSIAAPTEVERDAALEEAAKLCDFQATWAKGEADDVENSVRYRHENRERQTAAELCAASIRAAIATGEKK